MSAGPPDTELLLTPECPHCPVVQTILGELVKQGRIGRLTVINIAARPEEAEARSVRGVPWIRIGPFELTGAHDRSEIEQWIERAGSDSGMQTYLSESLEAGQLGSVTSACRRSPALRAALLALAADLDTPFAVRIGVGAVLEDLAGDGLLADLVDAIDALAGSELPQVRADAAHYLGLAGTAQARARLHSLLDDDDHEVREIAAESLAALGETTA